MNYRSQHPFIYRQRSDVCNLYQMMILSITCHDCSLDFHVAVQSKLGRTERTVPDYYLTYRLPKARNYIFYSGYSCYFQFAIAPISTSLAASLMDASAIFMNNGQAIALFYAVIFFFVFILNSEFGRNARIYCGQLAVDFNKDECSVLDCFELNPVADVGNCQAPLTLGELFSVELLNKMQTQYS